PDYRQRGYATIVVGALLKHLLAVPKVPIWSCAAANIASQRLAESVGYAKFADVVALTCS
ncbi:MAG: GNAT family N-acetyltransferase, partial [Anaerolineae bacterium]|nr:GNAT family N-acetyltransferase [Anaerolineae bacterium]